MELPITVVFEPPSRKELRALLRMRGIWVVGTVIALAIGTVFFIFGPGRNDAVASVPAVRVQVASRPSDAHVWIDERDAGYTPLSLSVPSGTHTVVFKASDAIDARYTLQADLPESELHAILWRRQPLATRLRSTLPGAQLSDARLLTTGEIALTLSLPVGRQMQNWRLDPTSGAVEPLLTDASGSRSIVSSDGTRIAVLGFDVGPRFVDSGSITPTTVLWLYTAGARVPIGGSRPPLPATEHLADATWSPRTDRLFVVSTQPVAGGAALSRLWFVEATTLEARLALSLPSEVVPGTASWSPDGQHVAFVAHATGLDALCVVDLDGGFRYVADLDSRVEQPPGYPVATWSADSQRLIFVAPKQRPLGSTGAWFQQADPARVLYVAASGDAAPTPLTDTTIDIATWREDGQILGLGRVGNGGALDMRLMTGSPGGDHLVELPLKPSGPYAVEWDVAHAEALIASSGASGEPEFWLLRLGWSDPA